MYGRFPHRNCLGMVSFLKSSCLGSRPYLNRKSAARSERRVMRGTALGKSRGQWTWLSQMCVGSFVLPLCHHYTSNTGVRRSTGLSWLWLLWGQISNWKIQLKTLRGGPRQFAKIWEVLIFQRTWDWEKSLSQIYLDLGARAPYGRVTMAGLGLLSLEKSTCKVSPCLPSGGSDFENVSTIP